MFLRISIDQDYEHHLTTIYEILDGYNFKYTLKCESYKESKLKFPGETWVIGDGKKADLTLVINVKNRNQEEMINWIIICLDKKMK